jgi:deoxyribodipyrimidine photolyase
MLHYIFVYIICQCTHIYIKRWIPELADVPNQDIHNWETAFTNYKDIKYPKPMVNYAEQKEKCLKMYKDALY